MPSVPEKDHQPMDSFGCSKLSPVFLDACKSHMHVFRVLAGGTDDERIDSFTAAWEAHWINPVQTHLETYEPGLKLAKEELNRRLRNYKNASNEAVIIRQSASTSHGGISQDDRRLNQALIRMLQAKNYYDTALNKYQALYSTTKEAFDRRIEALKNDSHLSRFGQLNSVQLGHLEGLSAKQVKDSVEYILPLQKKLLKKAYRSARWRSWVFFWRRNRYLQHKHQFATLLGQLKEVENQLRILALKHYLRIAQIKSEAHQNTTLDEDQQDLNVLKDFINAGGKQLLVLFIADENELLDELKTHKLSKRTRSQRSALKKLQKRLKTHPVVMADKVTNLVSPVEDLGGVEALDDTLTLFTRQDAENAWQQASDTCRKDFLNTFTNVAESSSGDFFHRSTYSQLKILAEVCQEDCGASSVVAQSALMARAYYCQRVIYLALQKPYTDAFPGKDNVMHLIKRLNENLKAYQEKQLRSTKRQEQSIESALKKMVDENDGLRITPDQFEQEDLDTILAVYTEPKTTMLSNGVFKGFNKSSQQKRMKRSQDYIINQWWQEWDNGKKVAFFAKLTEKDKNNNVRAFWGNGLISLVSPLNGGNLGSLGNKQMATLKRMAYLYHNIYKADIYRVCEKKESDAFYDYLDSVHSTWTVLGALKQAGEMLGISTSMSAREVNKKQAEKVNELKEKLFESIQGSGVVEIDAHQAPALRTETAMKLSSEQLQVLVACYTSFKGQQDKSKDNVKKREQYLADLRRQGISQEGRDIFFNNLYSNLMSLVGNGKEPDAANIWDLFAGKECRQKYFKQRHARKTYFVERQLMKARLIKTYFNLKKYFKGIFDEVQMGQSAASHWLIRSSVDGRDASAVKALQPAFVRGLKAVNIAGRTVERCEELVQGVLGGGSSVLANVKDKFLQKFLFEVLNLLKAHDPTDPTKAAIQSINQNNKGDAEKLLSHILANKEIKIADGETPILGVHLNKKGLKQARHQFKRFLDRQMHLKNNIFHMGGEEGHDQKRQFRQYRFYLRVMKAYAFAVDQQPQSLMVLADLFNLNFCEVADNILLLSTESSQAQQAPNMTLLAKKLTMVLNALDNKDTLISELMPSKERHQWLKVCQWAKSMAKCDEKAFLPAGHVESFWLSREEQQAHLDLLVSYAQGRGKTAKDYLGEDNIIMEGLRFLKDDGRSLEKVADKTAADIAFNGEAIEERKWSTGDKIHKFNARVGVERSRMQVQALQEEHLDKVKKSLAHQYTARHEQELGAQYDREGITDAWKQRLAKVAFIREHATGARVGLDLVTGEVDKLFARLNSGVVKGLKMFSEEKGCFKTLANTAAYHQHSTAEHIKLSDELRVVGQDMFDRAYERESYRNNSQQPLERIRAVATLLALPEPGLYAKGFAKAMSFVEDPNTPTDMTERILVPWLSLIDGATCLGRSDKNPEESISSYLAGAGALKLTAHGDARLALQQNFPEVIIAVRKQMNAWLANYMKADKKTGRQKELFRIGLKYVGHTQDLTLVQQYYGKALEEIVLKQLSGGYNADNDFLKNWDALLATYRQIMQLCGDTQYAVQYRGLDDWLCNVIASIDFTKSQISHERVFVLWHAMGQAGGYSRERQTLSSFAQLHESQELLRQLLFRQCLAQIDHDNSGISEDQVKVFLSLSDYHKDFGRSAKTQHILAEKVYRQSLPDYYLMPKNMCTVEQWGQSNVDLRDGNWMDGQAYLQKQRTKQLKVLLNCEDGSRGIYQAGGTKILRYCQMIVNHIDHLSAQEQFRAKSLRVQAQEGARNPVGAVIGMVDNAAKSVKNKVASLISEECVRPEFVKGALGDEGYSSLKQSFDQFTQSFDITKDHYENARTYDYAKIVLVLYDAFAGKEQWRALFTKIIQQLLTNNDQAEIGAFIEQLSEEKILKQLKLLSERVGFFASKRLQVQMSQFSQRCFGDRPEWSMAREKLYHTFADNAELEQFRLDHIDQMLSQNNERWALIKEYIGLLRGMNKPAESNNLPQLVDDALSDLAQNRLESIMLGALDNWHREDLAQAARDSMAELNQNPLFTMVEQWSGNFQVQSSARMMFLKHMALSGEIDFSKFVKDYNQHHTLNDKIALLPNHTLNDKIALLPTDVKSFIKRFSEWQSSQVLGQLERDGTKTSAWCDFFDCHLVLLGTENNDGSSVRKLVKAKIADLKRERFIFLLQNPGSHTERDKDLFKDVAKMNVDGVFNLGEDTRYKSEFAASLNDLYVDWNQLYFNGHMQGYLKGLYQAFIQVTDINRSKSIKEIMEKLGGAENAFKRESKIANWIKGLSEKSRKNWEKSPLTLDQVRALFGEGGLNFQGGAQEVKAVLGKVAQRAGEDGRKELLKSCGLYEGVQLADNLNGNHKALQSTFAKCEDIINQIKQIQDYYLGKDRYAFEAEDKVCYHALMGLKQEVLRYLAMERGAGHVSSRGVHPMMGVASLFQHAEMHTMRIHQGNKDHDAFIEVDVVKKTKVLLPAPSFFSLKPLIAKAWIQALPRVYESKKMWVSHQSMVTYIINFSHQSQKMDWGRNSTCIDWEALKDEALRQRYEPALRPEDSPPASPQHDGPDSDTAPAPDTASLDSGDGQAFGSNHVVASTSPKKMRDKADIRRFNADLQAAIAESPELQLQLQIQETRESIGSKKDPIIQLEELETFRDYLQSKLNGSDSEAIDKAIAGHLEWALPQIDALQKKLASDDTAIGEGPKKPGTGNDRSPNYRTLCGMFGFGRGTKSSASGEQSNTTISKPSQAGTR